MRRRLRLPIADPRRVTGKYRALALTGAFVAVILVMLTWAPYLGAHRPATESETIYGFFAENLGEADLCTRISWAAFRRYSVLFGGGGASYARSDCYEGVAQRNHDPGICWRVRPLIDIDPFSSGYSALSCWQRAKRGGATQITLSPQSLNRAFEVLGYNADTLYLEGVIGPAIRPADVYRGLERKPGIVERVQLALARPVAALGPDGASYLAHLSAVTAGDPQWCERIPTATLIPTEAIPFRDWCYLTVAYDDFDARICERMTPAAGEAKVMQAKAHGVRPEIAEQFSARADCARIGHWVGPRPHYGPEVPPDATQIESLVAALGFDMPRARFASVRDRGVLRAFSRCVAGRSPGRCATPGRPREAPLPNQRTL